MGRFYEVSENHPWFLFFFTIGHICQKHTQILNARFDSRDTKNQCLFGTLYGFLFSNFFLRNHWTRNNWNSIISRLNEYPDWIRGGWTAVTWISRPMKLRYFDLTFVEIFGWKICIRCENMRKKYKYSNLVTKLKALS